MSDLEFEQQEDFETDPQEIQTEERDELEVEVVDDTPEEDRDKPRRPDGAEPDLGDDEELQDVSKKVQSRISKLRYEYHEERRAKEEAQRLREEAINMAKQAYEENQRLKQTLAQGENVLVDQAKSRIESQIKQAEISYRNAYESGDSDQIIQAQRQLSALEYERAKLGEYKPVQYQPDPEPEFFNQQQARPQVPKPDAKAMAWAERNPWFQTDPEMTSYAFGVHQKLVEQGYDPTSDAYYEQIDENVRKRFPENFGNSQRPGNVVAPAGRASKSPRKIKLTKTQVALAKRLGITPEQYAAQMLKEQR